MMGVLSFSCPRGLFGNPLEGMGVLGCRPLSCVSYGSATVVLPGVSPSFQCPHSFPLYSPSSVRGLALGAALAALHTLGEIAPAPLFTAAFFCLSWLWWPFLLALRCILLSCASALLSLFVFLLPGVFLRLSSVGLCAPPLPCAALYFSLVWDRRLCFPFFLSVSGCSSALWAESVTFWVFCTPSRSLSRAFLLAPRSCSSSASLLLVLSSSPSSGGSFLLEGPCYSSSRGFPV